MTGPVAFCIGLNRTGTTTFGDACEVLGLSRLGWTDESHFLVKAWQAHDIAPLIDAAGRHDVLEDLPWPLVYREMAESFPRARFVLTRRISVDVWLRSQSFHTRSEYGMHRVIYGATSASKSPDLYRRRYEQHLAEVRAFFDGSDRLLEVCWEEGDAWEALCSFLGRPVPLGTAFPHSNARPPRRSRLASALRRAPA